MPTTLRCGTGGAGREGVEGQTSWPLSARAVLVMVREYIPDRRGPRQGDLCALRTSVVGQPVCSLLKAQDTPDGWDRGEERAVLRLSVRMGPGRRESCAPGASTRGRAWLGAITVEASTAGRQNDKSRGSSTDGLH